MADMQPQPPQQGVQQVKIISSGGSGSGSRPLQMMSNPVVGGSGSSPAPLILNASPEGVRMQSSSTPVMIQSSPGVQPSPSGSGQAGVVIMQAGGAVGSATSPQPAATVNVAPGAGIMIRSATTALPSYNGPSAGHASQSAAAMVVQPQPQPVAFTPSPVVQPGAPSPAAMSSGVIRIGGGTAAASPQTYGSSQPAAVALNKPTAAEIRPSASTDLAATTARQSGPATTSKTTSGPRLTPGELLSKADPLWVCGFLLAVVGVAFATMVFEDEVSMTALLLFVSAASIGAFVKLQL